MTHKFKLALCAVLAAPLVFGQGNSVQTRRASMTGSRGSSGKCTIEVRVDGTAEVEIYGDTGRLRTLAGYPATWTRMECSDPLPRNPGDFRFRGIDGRGRQELVADPRNNRGVAVVRIDDPKGGSEGYTFDIEWNGNYGGQAGGPGYYPGNGAPQMALDGCRAEVEARAARDFGYRMINITSIAADNNPGRRDWVMGSFEGRRGPERESFRFNCSVDFASGRVRSVDIVPVRGGGGPQRNTAQAVRWCQDAVVERLRRDGYRDVDFQTTDLDNRPGRNDWVLGGVTARRGPVGDRFEFACSVDFTSGRVRSVDVKRR